ncbi:UDP-glucose/GDP-mannose dehydrogenase family protein [Nocardioides sp. AE5]|uniref:UDP-glucose dehydrogenase family protein n=1 Tax=Nocardioides sp. AE5 TaxID=2962573 RepID=UPI0028823D93|nr:UDP-glucose/GDP-mannose dehydrogenase family protein [Nocardioides sp. AE5]MDT0203799.1 UDP-glucose/GDP-mannose dehydrogenase family protein [Nocardioides sp. AE5]
MRVSVIGTGYLGAVHAAGMAELGFDVIGIDVDAAKVEALSAGHAPFYEPGLEELLARHVGPGGRLRFTTDFAEARGAEVHFLCIGTPQASDSDAADLTFVEAAVRSLAEHLVDQETLVVGKSTVPVGTAARMQDLLTSIAGAGVELAWNPEFLREGFAVEDTLRPDRLVLGVTSDRAEALLRTVYAATIEAGTPVVVSDFATAELVKVSANAFLATKISFINAMSEVCDLAGADVGVLADAIGFDERIGRKFLNAGLGFGGGCLPKDIRAFRARATELGAGETFNFLDEVDRINVARRARVVTLAEELLGDLAGRRIAVLGASFKPKSDDVRDSPALDVASRLVAAGADVRIFDPVAGGTGKRAFPDLTFVSSIDEAAEDAEAVLHLTEWPEFREIDPAVLAKVVATANVIDARNCLDRDAWRAAGWTYRGLGVQ